MEQKGFAITGILYTLLLIAVVSMNLLLYNLLNRKTILDQIKTDTVNAIEKDSDFDYIMKEINELKLNKADRIEVQEVNKIATNAQTLASNAATKSELQSLNNIVNTKITMSEALDKAYPIGSIYMTLTNVNPRTLFGGTWERIQDRFLLGASNHYAVNSMGGTTSHNHANGNYYAAFYLSGVSNGTNGRLQFYASTSAGKSYNSNFYSTVSSINYGQTAQNNAQTVGVSVYGESSTTTAIPPYLAVYMWKRIG